jgi:glycosyltransferase involved in cell wall biosynthesis
MAKLCTLSVVMIVKNEARHLSDCLDTVVEIADEIIVLDSGSTDNTEHISRGYNARFYLNSDWQGFGKQRQLAQSYASCDYVLAIDADERLDPVLQKSVAQVLSQPLNSECAFAVMRRNIYMGKAVHLLGYRTKLDRLYARTSFDFSDQDVHESLKCDRRKSIVLKGNLRHYSCDSLHHLIEKNLRYSKEWAVEKHRQGKKTLLITPFVKGLVSFVRDAIFRGAVFAGTRGLLVAMVGAFYSFNKYLILYKLCNSRKPPKQSQPGN